jgi:DNA-directed RNA polymerase beta subunit
MDSDMDYDPVEYDSSEASDIEYDSCHEPVLTASERVRRAHDATFFPASTHIQSFDKFIEEAPSIISTGKFSDDKYSYELHCEHTVLHNPKITPEQARLKGLSYLSEVTCEKVAIEVRSDGNLVKRFESQNILPIKIGVIPVMVGSSLCIDPHGDDIGGFFIVNGYERVVVSAESKASTYPLVSKGAPPDPEFSVSLGSVSIGLKKRLGAEPCLTLSTRKAQLNFCTVMRVLGFEDFDDLEDDTNIKHILDACKLFAPEPTEEGDETVREELDARVLTGPEYGDNDCSKAAVLLDMLSKLLSVATGRAAPDDRDDWSRKRIKTSGKLMESLLRNAVGRMCADTCRGLKSKVAPSPQPVTAFIQNASIHRFMSMPSAVSSGNWPSYNVGAVKVPQKGMTQVSSFRASRDNRTIGLA